MVGQQWCTMVVFATCRHHCCQVGCRLHIDQPGHCIAIIIAVVFHHHHLSLQTAYSSVHTNLVIVAVFIMLVWRHSHCPHFTVTLAMGIVSLLLSSSLLWHENANANATPAAAAAGWCCYIGVVEEVSVITFVVVAVVAVITVVLGPVVHEGVMSLSLSSVTAVVQWWSWSGGLWHHYHISVCHCSSAGVATVVFVIVINIVVIIIIC